MEITWEEKQHEQTRQLEPLTLNKVMKIKDYQIDGEEPNVLYAMVEEDEKAMKVFLRTSVFLVEMAMNMRAKDWNQRCASTSWIYGERNHINPTLSKN